MSMDWQYDLPEQDQVMASFGQLSPLLFGAMGPQLASSGREKRPKLEQNKMTQQFHLVP